MNTPTNQPEQIWTLKEVALRLRVSERTMHNLLDSGQIEGMFLASRWKFTEKAVCDYEESTRRKEGKGAKKKRAYHRKQA